MTSSFKILISSPRLSFYPRTRGVQAITAIPFFWASSTNAVLGRQGWTYIWSATGLILQMVSNSMINCPLKLEIPKCFTYPFVMHCSISGQIYSSGLWLNYPCQFRSVQGQCRQRRSKYLSCMSCKDSFSYFCTLYPLKLKILVAINNSYLFTLPSDITVLIAFPRGIQLLYNLAVSICLHPPTCKPFLSKSVRTFYSLMRQVPRP